jgi:hypothetical protein
MLTPLATKEEDETKISSEYYSTHYTPQHHYYYHHHHHPVSFTDDTNNLHPPQTPSVYDPTQYYTLSPGYSQPNSRIINEDDSNNQISSSIYMPIYHHHHRHPHYSPEDMLFTQKTSEQQYEYNLSPNQMFHQHTNYIQTPGEQTVCSTSNGGDYLTPYVSEIISNPNKFHFFVTVTIEWSLPIGYNYC